jgi:hypothetical protein
MFLMAKPTDTFLQVFVANAPENGGRKLERQNGFIF